MDDIVKAFEHGIRIALDRMVNLIPLTCNLFFFFFMNFSFWICKMEWPCDVTRGIDYNQIDFQ